MAVIIYQYLQAKNIKLQSVNDSKEFTDGASISPWAKEAVSYMQRAGIISGKPDGSFRPQGTATRAEVAAILMNLDDKLQ